MSIPRRRLHEAHRASLRRRRFGDVRLRHAVHGRYTRRAGTFGGEASMAGAKVRLPQYRGVVMGRGGMVASANPLASAAGLQVLREGGTAADAVIAAALVTGVTICGTNGIGGDMFCLYYDAATRTVTGFNGSGAAGQLATIDEMRKRGVSILPF